MAKHKRSATADRSSRPESNPTGICDSGAESAVEEHDRQLALAAVQKLQNGQAPTRSERAGLKRYEKAREEQRRWKHYRTIPQKHWLEMSGRQARTINEQAIRYGIPLAGETLDLPAIVRAFHNHLAKIGPHYAKWFAGAGDDPLLGGESTPALERLRTATAELRELELDQRRGLLLARDEVHTGLNRLSQILRSAGEILQRDFGADANAVLEEALGDFEREVGTWLDPNET